MSVGECLFYDFSCDNHLIDYCCFVSLLLFPQTSPTTSIKFGHFYDVSKKMSPELLQSIKWHSFFLPDELPLEPKLKMW